MVGKIDVQPKSTEEVKEEKPKTEVALESASQTKSSEQKRSRLQNPKKHLLHLKRKRLNSKEVIKAKGAVSGPKQVGKIMFNLSRMRMSPK